MKIYIKVALAFFALLFGGVALTEYFSTHHKKEPFQLINQVEENDLAFHADFTKIFLDIDKYKNGMEITLTNRLAISQVKQQLLKSGLNLNEIYMTFSIYKNQTATFYAEIEDTTLFESAFDRLSDYFDLAPSEKYSNFYSSLTANLSVEKHPQYIKINWGKATIQEKSDSRREPSPLFIHLLQSANSGVINTTGTSNIDSTDYATFTYEYQKDFSLTAEWTIEKNHPVQLKQDSISIYPSQKNTLQAYTNIDIEQLKQHTNSLLKRKGIAIIEKLPKAAREILKLWNGLASFQIGGKTADKTIQYVTDFDDNFNKIERTIIKIDSIPDLGFFWGTSDSKATFNLLHKVPNVRVQSPQLQLALFPPLNVKQESNALKAASTGVDFKQEKSNSILFIHSESQLFPGSLTIQQASKKTVQLKLLLKDLKGLTLPEKFSTSSFW